MKEKILKYFEFIESTKKLINSKPTRFFNQSNKEFTENYPNLYSKLRYWYREIFKCDINLRTCSIFVDTFFELNNLKINQVMEKIQLFHTLKPGRLFEIDNIDYSNKSKHLTNEICEQIFRKYGAGAFEKYDPNWREKPVINHEDIKEDLRKPLTKQTAKKHFEIIPESVKLPEEKPLNRMNLKELRQYAQDNGLIITKRVKKDIVKELKDQK